MLTASGLGSKVVPYLQSYINHLPPNVQSNPQSPSFNKQIQELKLLKEEDYFKRGHRIMQYAGFWDFRRSILRNPEGLILSKGTHLSKVEMWFSLIVFRLNLFGLDFA